VAIFELGLLNWYLYCLSVFLLFYLYFMHFADLMIPTWS